MFKGGTSAGRLSVCYLAFKMIGFGLLRGHSITDGNLNVFVFSFSTIVVDRPINKNTVSFCLT